MPARNQRSDRDDDPFQFDRASLGESDFTTIRRLCARPPLPHHVQAEHLRKIRTGNLEIFDLLAHLPAALEAVVALRSKRCENLAGRREAAQALAITSALWHNREAPGWAERYAEQLATNAALVHRTAREIEQVSERRYADVDSIGRFARSKLETALASTPRTAADYARVEESLRCPLPDLLRTHDRIQAVEREIRHPSNEMLDTNYRLVLHTIKWMGKVSPDAFNEGVLGLMNAIPRFRPELGFKFSTFATWWIRQAVERPDGEDSLIRIPPEMQALLRREASAREQLTQELRGPSRDEEVYARLQSDSREIESLKRTRFFLRSAGPDRFGEESQAVLLVPDRAASGLRQVEEQDQHRDLARAIDRLFNRRDREVMRRRYLAPVVDGTDIRQATFDEIAEACGITRSRAQQIDRSGVGLMIDHAILRQSAPERRDGVMARVLLPWESRVIRNLLSDDFTPLEQEELVDGQGRAVTHSTQQGIVHRLGVCLVIHTMGEQTWRKFVTDHGVPEARAFVLHDRIFGPVREWSDSALLFRARWLLHAAGATEEQACRLFSRAALFVTKPVREYWQANLCDAPI